MESDNITGKASLYGLAALAVCTLAIGAWTTCRYGQAAEMRQCENLCLHATVIAGAIIPEHIAGLSFTAADESLPAFERLRRQMIAAAEHLVVHQIYSVALRNGKYVFGPESYPRQHPQASKPGTVYQRHPPELETVFATGQPLATKPFRDEFGHFVSAFAPVISPRTGEVLMVLGIDSDASAWQAGISGARKLPVIITLAFLSFVLIGLLVKVKRQRLGSRSIQYLPHAETALCCIAMTILVLTFAWQAHQKESRQRENSFISAAYSHMSGVSREILEIGKILENTECLFAASEHVDRREFQLFTQKFDDNSAADTFMWLPKVPGTERAAFEAEVRQHGAADFSIWQLDQASQRVPVTAQDFHYPIHFIEAKTSYDYLRGFDMGTFPVVRETIRSCMAENLPSATDTLRLGHREDKSCTIVLFFQPVSHYHQKGLVAATVQLQNLIRMPTYKIGPLTKHLAATLFQLEPEAPPVFLASTENDSACDSGYWHTDCSSGLSIKVPIFCFGKTYALSIRAKPEWLKNYPLREHRIILLGGLLLTAALTSMVALLINRRTALEREVQAQTADLRRERKLLYALMDSLPDRIFFKDQDLRFTKISRAFAETLKLSSPEEAVGRTIDDFLPPALAAVLHNSEHAVMATGNPLLAQVEQSSGPDSKPRWVSSSTVALKEDDGSVSGLIGISRDITYEIELQQQLQQASKMDAIGRLAGGVAHDFNNLLQAILGFTELLLSGLDDSDPQYGDLKQIEQAAKRASDLTRQLLAFSRKQKIEPRPVDLNEAVRTTDKMLRRILGEDVEILHNLSPEIKPVMVDPTQIEQVIINLAVNARDAMPQGGRLTFNTSLVHLSQIDTQIINESMPGTFVCLAVSDSGVGISAENLPHIFEPFFTTKPRGKGTGLGLSVIYGIVKQTGGWINVYSEPGQGSTFKIFLPASDQSVSEIAEALPQAMPLSLPGLGKHILLVEDESGILNLVSLILQGAGFKVKACESADAAIAAFDQAQGHFDLLFSDIILGGMNGVDLACLLRQRRPDLPVLLCSGYADERVRWEMIEMESFNFLAKPYPSVKLLSAIGEILRKPGPAPLAVDD